MAGNAEILKAYVTLAADTSSLRTSLTAASAEVEAWKRKTQVTVPLYKPGTSPGSPGGPIDQTTQATTRMEQATVRATAATDKNTDSIHRQRAAFGRLVSTVSLATGVFYSFYNIGRRIYTVLLEPATDKINELTRNMNMVGSASTAALQAVQTELEKTERRIREFGERGALGGVFDIEAAYNPQKVIAQYAMLRRLEASLLSQTNALRQRVHDEARKREEAAQEAHTRRMAESELESQRAYMLELDRQQQKQREAWREWFDDMRRGLMSLPDALTQASERMSAQMRNDVTSALADINRQLDSATTQRIASRMEVVSQQLAALVAVTRRSR